MSIEFIKGDVTKVFPNEKKIIPHVVNSHGIMATGVAYGLYSKWPKVKEQYNYWYENRYHHPRKISDDAIVFDLGENQAVYVDQNTIVINMVAQKLGTNLICGIQVPPIRLWALKECIMKVRDFMMVNEDYKIVAPKFGSLRAGGCFDRDILPMIEKYWGDFDVTICEFEE
jgi:hypothetical protein